MPRRDWRRVAPWLGRLLGPTEAQLGCEECFEQLDRYVELEAAGIDAAARFPRLQAHLEGCNACRQEHDELLELVRQRES
jgi:hypothetical protein